MAIEPQNHYQRAERNRSSRAKIKTDPHAIPLESMKECQGIRRSQRPFDKMSKRYEPR